MATAHIETATANSTTWVNLVKQPKGGGEVGGVLTGLGIASAAEYHFFRVTIDGNLIVDQFLAGSNATTVSANNGLGLYLPFDKSIVVDICDLPHRSSLTVYWATYLTYNTDPLGEPEIYTTDVEGQTFVRKITRYGTEEQSYAIDSLVGPALWSQVNLSTDCFIGDEPVTGAVILWREPGRVPESLERLELIVRPAGLTRELDRIRIEHAVEGSAEFYYDGRPSGLRAGTFEIVADLPRAANKPGRYLRL
jgi:hypothetical protein